MLDLKVANLNEKLVYIDPGKRLIGTFLGYNGKYYNYTSKKRIKKLKEKNIWD